MIKYKFLLLLFTFLICANPIFSQTKCFTNIINKADSNFNIGNFEESITICIYGLENCSELTDEETAQLVGYILQCKNAIKVGSKNSIANNTTTDSLCHTTNTNTAILQEEDVDSLIVEETVDSDDKSQVLAVVKALVKESKLNNTYPLQINGSIDDIEMSPNPIGDTLDFIIKSNAEYSIDKIPLWCTILNNTRSTFQIKCDTNLSNSTRIGVVEVRNDNGEILHIKITQNAYSPAFSINGKTSTIYTVVDHQKGEVSFKVNSNSYKIDVNTLPNWCYLKAKNNSEFIISYEENRGISKLDSFKVVHRNGIQTVIIEQLTANNLTDSEWRTLLFDCIKNSAKMLKNNGHYYMGETENSSFDNSRLSGLGCYYYSSTNTLYIGEFEDGLRTGMGMYILGDPVSSEFKNCPNGVYYVGNWRQGVKYGYGTCYDAYGNCLYVGDFINDSPIANSYPNAIVSHINYKFECIKFDSSGTYVGETLNGKSNGRGLFIYSNGELWYGEWMNGQKKGKGILFKNDGNIISGNWIGDKLAE